MVWTVPTLVASLLVLLRWSPRGAGGALLATTWCGWSTLAVGAWGIHAQWWRYESVTPSIWGVPITVWIGWTMLWGPVALLALPRVPLVVVMAVALFLDLHLMPAVEPLLVLGTDWGRGEALALLVVLLPAQLLGRWTRDDRRLGGRVILHLIQFGMIMMVCLPAAFLPEGGLGGLRQHPLWIQALGIAALPGLAAVLEFARRGGGTPVPFDAPKRLVTTGPYAYVANPMQISFALYALVLAAWTSSATVAGIALMAVAFTGFGRWSEARDLTSRFGSAWTAYREGVGHWIPRWRPWVPHPATLYVARDCAACQQLAAWLTARDPVGLHIVDAEDHPTRRLDRLTWAPNEGGEEDGMRAFGCALEHLNLGWAVLGMGLRLPGVHHLATLLGDAVGAGPREVEWGGPR